MIIRNLSVIVENTGKRIPIEEINSTVTICELLDILAKKINLPQGTNSALIRKMTRKRLLSTETLEGAGIQDGETLLADFERTAGGSFPVRSLTDI